METNQLAIYQSGNLPAKLEDLAKFVLVGREQLVAVRAAIRAMDKLELANEVREQKREEARMISEALLDAEVKIGELMEEIPKAAGARIDLEPRGSGALRLREEPHLCTEAKLEQPTKAARVSELGFSNDQAKRFQTLAKNKDLIPQVKAEARENGTLPTRGRVLELAKQRKLKDPFNEMNSSEYSAYRDKCHKMYLSHHKAIVAAAEINVDPDHLAAWKESTKDVIPSYLRDISIAIAKLVKIQSYLKELVK